LLPLFLQSVAVKMDYLKLVSLLFDYNDWAFGLMWGSIDQLDDAQFTAELDYSFGSIHNQVIHIISSHRRWLDRLRMQDVSPHLKFSDFPTKHSAKAEWDNTQVEVLDYVHSLDQSDLDQEVAYELRGRSFQGKSRRWEILLHLANHSTDHRSQILAMMAIRFGIATPEQDLLFYLWNRDLDT
jgi:uncharacterized damage-inducible protein DinB